MLLKPSDSFLEELVGLPVTFWEGLNRQNFNYEQQCCKNTISADGCNDSLGSSVEFQKQTAHAAF